MDIVQGTVVFVANVVAPWSGVAVNAAFELGKTCFEIAQVLAGVKDKASAIQTQQENIEKYVKKLSAVLQTLERIQNQDALTPGLQSEILEFKDAVDKYYRVVMKFSRYNQVKQLVFRRGIEEAGAEAHAFGKDLYQHVAAECAIDGSRHHGVQERISAPVNPIDVLSHEQTLQLLSEPNENQDARYIEMFQSPEVIREMQQPDVQKEMLSIIFKKKAENAVTPSGGHDRVLSVMETKLLNLSSRSVQDEANNLPDWFITEDKIDFDPNANGFGGDGDKGGMEDEKIVAVKMMKFGGEDQMSNQAARSENNSEALKSKIANTAEVWFCISRLSPYICGFEGACRIAAPSSTPFFVMEFCDRGTLDQLLGKDESSREQTALELLSQAAQAIHKMHEKGFVHGDLKCDNILVTGDPWQARVCDFDRSFNHRAITNGHRADKIKASEMGVHISEAVRFLAPECVEGMLPSPRSDVYSFGMTIFQALMGESPYADVAHDDEVREWKRDGDLPHRDKEKVSDDVWGLIKRCCHQSPGDRPPMGVIAKELKSLLAKRSQLYQQDGAENGNNDEKADENTLVEKHVDATLGVDHAGVLLNVDDSMQPDLPTRPDAKDVGLTPVKAISNTRRVIPWRLIALGVVVALVGAGIAAYFIVSKPSSATSTRQGSGNDIPQPTTTPSPSTATPSPTTAPTPPPTTPAPTVTTVSTIAGSNGSTTFVGLRGVMISGDYIYFADETRVFRVQDGSPASLYSGDVTNGYVDGPRMDARYATLRAIVTSVAISSFVIIGTA